MTNSKGIDYVNTYFEYPALTQIHGKPTYESLKMLKKQLQANTTTVNCLLGGGEIVHLGLVLTITEYVSVCIDAYIRSILPPALVIPNGMAQHESIWRNPEHDKLIRQYNEVTDVDISLKRQLDQALDPVYVRSFYDPMTN